MLFVNDNGVYIFFWSYDMLSVLDWNSVKYMFRKKHVMLIILDQE